MTPPLSLQGCLNAATVSGLDLLELITLASEARVGLIEVSIQQVVAYGTDTVQAALADYGVGVAAASGIEPAGPVLPAPLLTPTDKVFGEHVERHLATMARIGCPVATVLLNPATTLSRSVATRTAVRRLKLLAAQAETMGIVLAVEAVGVTHGLPAALRGRHSFVSTLPELDALLTQVGSPAVGVCVDSFHWAATGARISEIAAMSTPITHVQIADVPLDVPASRCSDTMRRFPGDGGLDWAGFIGAVTATGYYGPLSVELFNPDLRALPEIEIARRAAEGIRHVAAQAGP